MKKNLLTTSILLFFVAAYGQTHKYFLDNTLPFKDASNAAIPYPFTGGLLSPQFSNIDVNLDGRKDLFVFDRGGNKVLIFLNSEGPGPAWIYAPQYEFAFPKLNSWALLVDYNGDGKEDIFTATDPNLAGNSVAIYKNVTTGTTPAFELVKAPVTYDQNIQGLPEANVYCISGDISGFTDIDSDGDVDILCFSSSGAIISLYGNEAVEKGYSKDSLIYRLWDDCWGAFRENDDDRGIRLGEPCFGSRYYKKTGGIHVGSTLLFLDMNEDIDKELILGDVNYSQLTLLTNGKKEHSWDIDSIVAFDTTFPSNSQPVNVYTFPAAFFVDLNTGSGAKDLAVAPNESEAAKSLNQVWVYRNTGTDKKPVFTFEKNNFLQEWTIDHGSGVTPRFLDVDGDGLLDLILAHRGDFELTKNKADRLNWYKNTGTKTKPAYTLQNPQDFLGLIQDSIFDMKPAFGDLDGDGKTDMLIGDGEGELHFYKNTSSTGLSFAPPVKKYMGIDVGKHAVPQIIDLDKDGLPDLVIGKVNGFISFFKNRGTLTAPHFADSADNDSLGDVWAVSSYWKYIINNNGDIVDSTRVYNDDGYAAPWFADLDGNGTLELLVGSGHGKLFMYTGIDGNLNGTFTEMDTFVYNNISHAFGGIDLGGRIVPVTAKLSDSVGAKHAIMTGNFRGGLNYFNAVKDTTPTFGLPEIVQKLSISLFPNPAKNNVTISRSLQQYDGPLAVTLLDILGREIYAGNIIEGSREYTVPLEGIQPGVYFVTVNARGIYTGTEKVVVVK